MQPQCNSHSSEKDVERKAKGILSTIAKCIDTIRSVESFQPPTVKNAVSRTNSVAEGSGRRPIQLFDIFCEKGLYSEIIEFQKQEASTSAIESLDPQAEQDGRWNCVHFIFVPLIKLLTEYYQALDNLPQLQSATDLKKTSSKTKLKGRTKPIAPRGLLSLANYTDIACLLELIVCTSIMPLLEPFILSKVEDRCKTIPRAMAGRIPRRSLLWGTESVNYSQDGTKPKRKTVDDMISKIKRARDELSKVSIAISNLVLSDRFKPMLFPRHVADLFAALFQIERLDDLLEKYTPRTGTNNSNAKQKGCDYDEEENVLRIYLGGDSPNSVEIYSRIQTYQSLLFSGKRTPAWLRMRIGKALTELVTRDQSSLKAVIDVFVVAASSTPTEDVTSCSSRLGRVLCAMPFQSTDGAFKEMQYFGKLLDNLCSLLEIKQHPDKNIQGDDSVDIRNMCNILTVWAVLENLPRDFVRDIFFPKFIGGLMPSLSEPFSSHKTLLAIDRIYSLLMFTPPNLGRLKDCVVEYLCRLLLKSYHPKLCWRDGPGSLSAFSMITRIASSEGHDVLKCDIKVKATETLRIIVHSMLQQCGDNTKVRSREMIEKRIAISLLRAIAVNSWDMIGFVYYRSGDNLERRELSRESHEEENSSVKYHSFSELVDGMEMRSKFVISNVIQFFSSVQIAERTEYCNSSTGAPLLSSAMFRLLLLIYFESSCDEEGHRTKEVLPQSILTSIDEFKILSMMVLPSLCEKLTPSLLVSETTDDNCNRNGILQIIILILHSVSKQYGSYECDTSISSDTYLSLDDMLCNFSKCDVAEEASLNIQQAKGQASSIVEDSDTKLSIASIILSLLIAILELGSNKRSHEDEEDLKKLMPSLNALTLLDELTSDTNVGEDRSEFFSLKADIAEMCSHAMILISSRTISSQVEIDSDEEVSSQNETRSTSLERKLRDAEVNLSSEQPPLRARGLVMLRQLSYTIGETLIDSTNARKSASLITELDVNDHPIPPTSNAYLHIVEEIIRICIISLTDMESYVYLAGIQTLVAIADACPKHTIPIIIVALTSGTIQYQHTTLASDKKPKQRLSSSQRIKIADAITFIIRRRGSAIQEYANFLLNHFFNGDVTLNDSENESTSSGLEILQKTEKYFQGPGIDNNLYDTDISIDIEECRLRLNTGGPVFQIEEEDVIRASYISVINELLSSMKPFAVARYCNLLFDLGINALRLDSSRLVRRAAAMLCREIYSCALREISLVEDFSLDMKANLTFVIALVSCDELLLKESVERSISGSDVDLNINGYKGKAVQGKSRFFDSAIQARCREALDIRNTLEETHVLSIASLVTHTKALEDQNPTTWMLKEEFRMKTL